METNPCRLREAIGEGRKGEEAFGVIAEGLLGGGVDGLFFECGVVVSELKGSVGDAAEEEAGEFAGVVLAIDGCLEDIGLDVPVEGDVAAFKRSDAFFNAEPCVPVTIEQFK
jgi:hypothetical protein